MARTIQNRISNILRKMFTSDFFLSKERKRKRLLPGIQKQVDWRRTSDYVFKHCLVSGRWFINYKHLKSYRTEATLLVEKQSQWNLKRKLLLSHEHSSSDVIDPLFNIFSHILKFIFIWMFDYWISWSIFNNKQW